MSTPKISEFKKENRTHTISFRVTEDEYKTAEEWAAAEGTSVPDWCRKVTEERLKEASGMSLHTRLLYEEIARLRYITGQCFRLLAKEELDEEAWEKVKAIADAKGKEIADQLLRRMRGL